MSARYATILAAVCAASGAAWGDAPLAETASAFVYAVDSVPSPRAVKTASERSELAARTVTRQASEEVTLTAPDGTTTTLIASSSAATGVTFPSLDAGGLWTLSGSKSGAVTFTVRHSIDGTLGGGTAASPARIVDGDELMDYGAGEGYTFTMEGADTLLGALRLPSGFRLEDVGGGTWRISASVNGSLHEWAEIGWRADSRYEGPNRRSRSDTVPPVAYSGDGWRGNASKAATLTFVAPDGTDTVLNMTGAGAESFTFDKPGHWTVLLAADGKTSTADIFIRDLFMIKFK